MKTALVTGATGFIGTHLVSGLLAAGWRVHVVVRRLPEHALWDPAGVTVHLHDGSTECLISIMREAHPDVVFHLASLFLAQHEAKDVDRLILSNVLFGSQLLEAMQVNEVQRIINTGTSWQHYNDESYNPVCLYAATKQAFEAVLEYYVQACGIKAITLKLSDTYGPDDPRPKLLNLLDRVAKTQEPLSMSPGEQLIDLVHVDDVVDAYLLAAQRLFDGAVRRHECYGVSSGRPVSLKQLVAIYEQAAGVNLPIRWGERPYRKREVMTPWIGEGLPGWRPQVEFSASIAAGDGRLKPASKDPA